MHSLPQNSSDHIGELLDTLEHDLCDSPLTAMVQVTSGLFRETVRLKSRRCDNDAIIKTSTGRTTVQTGSVVKILTL